MAATPAAGTVTLSNHRSGEGRILSRGVGQSGCIALVRYGLRSAVDSRIENTVRVIDHLLKVETPHGPAWHRYNGDGYGEHADGSPFDGVGIGRIWPLLTGERGHYELAAGRSDVAEKMASSIEGLANESGLIPEQIWDANDIPEHQLYFGRPSGSAMPLVWRTRNTSSCVGHWKTGKRSTHRFIRWSAMWPKRTPAPEHFGASTSLAVR